MSGEIFKISRYVSFVNVNSTKISNHNKLKVYRVVSSLCSGIGYSFIWLSCFRPKEKVEFLLLNDLTKW